MYLWDEKRSQEPANHEITKFSERITFGLLWGTFDHEFGANTVVIACRYADSVASEQ